MDDSNWRVCYGSLKKKLLKWRFVAGKIIRKIWKRREAGW
jgi:hypothetical protein